MKDFIEVIIGGKSKEEIGEKIKGRMQIGDTAKRILKSDNFKITEKKVSLRLVRLSLADLGLKGGFFVFKDISLQARAMGLRACPYDVVGAELNFKCTLGIEPVPFTSWLGVTNDYLLEIRKGSSDKLNLEAVNSGPCVQYNESCLFLFACE
ncbi:hypothetical protein CVU82_04025 [Candidatus Falkowbacteria bacterium HGW-Falkowbacteria-1]|jgi:hypothetical protein|uniref:Uncharacterized protein n=1 Tax=Candidatus Falkowbacteria bacterium HGW-Falkowbacteria-1 TaxID=2013768 RepID=A0A2N2E8Y5_9BACT|nr:MAG: hypothetical protein CVU82_04025 [Candidatus Falkowbacteria bacterium HGW-Falkowbacteria-1]